MKATGAVLALVGLVAACGGGEVVGTSTGTGAGVGGAGSSTASGPTTASSSGSGQACTPYAQAACTCPEAGHSGQTTCAADGSGYGPCQGCPGGAGGAGGQGGTSSASSSSSGTGGAPNCIYASDCPGTDTACASRTCQAGHCGVALKASGELAGPQAAGDCADVVCDGQGATKSQPNAGDVPAGDACHAGSCAPGPMLSQVATGTPCAGGLCDKAGACVAHIPVICVFLGQSFYTGCDGNASLGIYSYIDYVSADPNTTQFCNGAPSDVGYCPSGNDCTVHFSDNSTKKGKCQ
jgi:hypothetical protein